MKTKRLVTWLIMSSLILGALPSHTAAAPLLDGSSIVIDGIYEDAWSTPLASDPLGDMSEPNLDLGNLYITEDTDNFYIGFDAFASSWGMAYGIYIDTDQVDGSGATSDPWGRAVNAVSTHLPEHTLYVWHDGGDWLQEAQLNHWNGSGWSFDSLVSQGGAQGYDPGADFVEYRIPKTALGNPTSISIEVFTTGGGGHAQDTVPSDGNVAYTNPDWSGDVTTLSEFITYPVPVAPIWFVRGDFNGWSTDNPMFDNGTNGDQVAGDGIFTAQVLIPAPVRYEFKIATADWGTSFPGSGNSWLVTTTDNELVTFTYDTRTLDDGWLPVSNAIGTSADPGTWTAVGAWQGWDNGNASTAMSALGNGIYELDTIIATPGDYQFKAVRTGTWDAIGADSRSVNAATATFATTVADQQVYLRVNTLTGRVQTEVIAPPPIPALDDNIWWDGLAHNSRDDLYRTPGGAVVTGTPVTLRFRTYKNDVSEVLVRVWNTAANGQSLFPMTKVTTTDEGEYGYDYWQVTIPAQSEPTMLWYRFIVRDGSDEDYYEDNDLFDGGWGQAYEDSPDYSFQINVYDPNFATPDWMKDAVIYQIFPDRFFNGNPKNDPEASDPTVYGNTVLEQAWDDLPEGYCRAYVGGTCDEGPLGRDFYGGDLDGVRQKLDYLEALGVTTIYFNPIFKAPSNHLYDTSDYTRIDPYFGSKGDFASLVQQARKHGIKIVLDGVFNHTSSDSLYFDKNSRYPTTGAFESQASPFYSWYTFTDWPNSYDSWWGFDTLPNLTEVQDVRDFIYGNDDSIARYWIAELGAAGWRLDVAPEKSHDWWQEFRPQVKSANPDAVIIGEIWDDASPWLLGNEFDSTMNYRFRRALIGFVNGDTNDPNQGFIRGLDPAEFDSVMQSIKEDYPEPAFYAMMNLVGSHDTQRILWVLTPGERNRTDKEFNLANLAEGKDKLQLLAIIQMTFPGAPTIYYGDEVGMTGDTDPDDRRAFTWDNIDAGMLTHYQSLTAIRQQYSFLRTGSYDTLLTGARVYAYGRKDASGAAVVAVNKGTSAQVASIPVAGYIPEGTILEDVLNGGTATVTDGFVEVNVNPRWGVILVTPAGIDLTPPPAPANLSATADDAAVTLTWDAVADAAAYNVYRSLVSGGGYERINASLQAGTDYTDTGVSNGTLYFYVVTALDAAGNESPVSNETSALPHMLIGWANLQWPPSISHTISAITPTENIYGQVWIDGHTGTPGATPGLLAQVGFGPDGSDPATSAEWVWVAASFNTDAGNNDEFKAQLLPETVGEYDYAYRYSTTAGWEWLYADRDGTGNGYHPSQAGSLTVNPSADTTAPAAPTNLRVQVAAPSFITLAWDAVADADLFRYEIFRDGVKIGSVPTGTTQFSDWDVINGNSYVYTVQAVDTSFNHSTDSNAVNATAQARQVLVTFVVSLPDTTPADSDIYMGGSFNGWNPGGTLMSRAGATATYTLSLYEGDQVEYKYTLGSWDFVEKDIACGELSNRGLHVVYGTDGTMSIHDSVANWRNISPCGN